MPIDPDSRITDLGESRLIGPPGTGKTRFLTREIHFDARQRGAQNVVAVSHTNAAAQELAGRNTILPADNIGTLHSLAYRAIGRPPLVQDGDLLEQFNANVHPHFRVNVGAETERDLEMRTGDGDDLLTEYERRRNAMLPQIPQTARFATVWEDFKRQVGGVDFVDMLEHAARDVDECPGSPQVLIADEVQDLSRLQLKLLWKWGARADKVVLAGDPDQSIYSFNGANPRVFLDNPADRQFVLEQSYRVPRAVHRWAVEWIRHNRVREDVNYKPVDRPGAVEELRACWKTPELLLPTITEALDADPVDAERPAAKIMILTTCAYMLPPLIAPLLLRGSRSRRVLDARRAARVAGDDDRRCHSRDEGPAARPARRRAPHRRARAARANHRPRCAGVPDRPVELPRGDGGVAA